MTRIPNAQLIDTRDGQIVVFPETLRLPGSRVRIRRVETGLLLEPLPEGAGQTKLREANKLQGRKKR
jgi:virulence-associated protein VagC